MYFVFYMIWVQILIIVKYCTLVAGRNFAVSVVRRFTQGKASGLSVLILRLAC
jgi:hypothetical protein